MAIISSCRHFKERWDRASDSCTHFIPCLSDPGRRSAMAMKGALVMLHLTYLALILFLDRDLIERTKKYPCYTALYLLLFVGTICQYFFTSGSSPGYVIDARRAYDGTSLFANNSVMSKQPACGSVVITFDENLLSNDLKRSHASWENLIMDMYPIGSSTRHWTCTYCSILQPPRSKHCHDCDKCVLQFDHHCVWLGTCIGQGNHCRFWWYIFEETALCLWTAILYVVYIRTHIFKAWWIDAIVVFILITLAISLIFLLLLLIFHSYLVITNQTTYELVRRKRIPYMRGIPDRIYPFSKGIRENVYNFCCNFRNGIYSMEPLPTTAEYEAMSRPYSCADVMRCRCC